MKRQQIEFRRFNYTLGEMEYSSKMAGGLEQFFSNDCCSELTDDEQFTGKLDCNGVKIFAGDMLNFMDSLAYKPMVVEFKDGAFRVEIGRWTMVLDELYIKSNQLIVIGNIHQHKELLGDNK